MTTSIIFNPRKSMGDKRRDQRKGAYNGSANNPGIDLRDFSIELQKMDLCSSECIMGRQNRKSPMIPCGLCDRWYHIECLGLPEGAPRCIRGLYFCQDCLGALRELRWLARRHRERETRFEALEALVASLGVEQALLKDRQDKMDAGAALGERAVRMGAALIKENAQLRTELVSAATVVGDERNLIIEQAETKRLNDFKAINELQRLIAQKPEDVARQQAIVPSSNPTGIIATVNQGFPAPHLVTQAPPYQKRKFLSTISSSLVHQDDDNYIYCDECRKEFLYNCPTHGPMKRIHDAIVADTDPMKAEHSLPPGLVFRYSVLPGAGMGVWTTIDMPKGTVFGPFVGKIRHVERPEALENGDYCWQLRSKTGPIYVDGTNKKESNWMRFVNSANFEAQRNLVAFQYKGHVFYRAIKPLATNTELLVWYGNEFASTVGALLAPAVYQGWNQILAPGVRTPPLGPSRSSPKQFAGFVSKADNARQSSGTSDSTTNVEIHLANKKAQDVVPSLLDRKYHCHVCGTSFIRVDHLNQHQQNVHGIEAGHWCHSCGLQFKESQNLRDHMTRRHGEGLPASRVVTNEPVYIRCEGCGLRFVGRAQLTVHLNSKRCRNNLGKPSTSSTTDSGRSAAGKCSGGYYQCKFCNAQFVLQGFLINHLRNKHANQTEPPATSQTQSAWDFECDFCKKRFLKSGTRKRHIAQCSMRPNKEKTLQLDAQEDSESQGELLEGEAGDWNTLSETEKEQLATMGYNFDSDSLVVPTDWDGAMDQGDVTYPDFSSDFMIKEESGLEPEVELQVDPEVELLVESNADPAQESSSTEQVGAEVETGELDSSDKAITEQEEDTEQEPFTPFVFVDAQIDTTGAVTLN